MMLPFQKTSLTALYRGLLPAASAVLLLCGGAAQAAMVTATVGADGTALPGGSAQVRFDLDYDEMSPVHAFQLDLLYDTSALDLQGFSLTYGGTSYSLSGLAAQLGGLGSFSADPTGTGFTLAWSSVFEAVPTALPLLDGVATVELEFTLTGLGAGLVAPVTLQYGVFDGNFDPLSPVVIAAANVTAQGNAVPEPSSVALLLAGFGAAGVARSAAAAAGRRRLH